MRRARLVALITSILIIVGVITPRAAAFTWLPRKCTGFAACDAAGMGNAGYENNYLNSYWGMYAGHNCTNYVAYRLIRLGVPTIRVGSQTGDAYNWGNLATQHGWQVDSTPAVGSVAWFTASSGLGSSAGHVAYVESVQGNLVTVSEDNYGGNFDWRQYYTSDVSGFIHVERLVGGGSSTPKVLTPATPAITGTARVGSALGVSAGTWQPSAVTLRYQWLRGGTAIPGATGSSYTPVPADQGARLSVRVTGSLTGYPTVSRTSTATAAVQPGRMGVPAPVIVGTVQVGQVLTAAAGSWAPSGATLRYQWLRAGQPIPGATGRSYTLVAQDQVTAIAVRVTGSMPGYATTTATSAPTAPVALGNLTSVAPTLTGTTQVGRTLTVNTGAWGPSGTAIFVDWFRGTTRIPQGRGATYTLTPSDLGSTITVKVIGKQIGYHTVILATRPTAKVTPGVVQAQTPAIAGTARVGQTLTGTAGAWTPASAPLRYQWLRNGRTIPGATGTAYTLQAPDLGARISLQVGVNATGYVTTTRVSATTSPVAIGTITADRPTIAGTLRVGSTLTGSAGTWSPAGVRPGYQWLRGGKPIPGATGATYTLQPADLGAAISLKISASPAGYTPIALTATAPGTVAAGTLTGPAPAITGSPRVGTTLTAQPGAWGPSGVRLAYQWLRNGTPIARATSATYVLTSADRTAQVSVRIVGTLAGYQSLTRTSALTARVQ